MITKKPKKKTGNVHFNHTRKATICCTVSLEHSGIPQNQFVSLTCHRHGLIPNFIFTKDTICNS